MKTICSFLLISALTLAADLPKAESLLSRYIEVTGGVNAYRALKSQTSRATVEFVGQNIKGTSISNNISPSRALNTTTLDGIGKIQSGSFDGLVWEFSAIQGPRIAKGEERSLQLRLADLNAALDWQKYYESMTTEAEESIDGQACYKVSSKPKDSDKLEYAWYSKDTGLLVKLRFTLVSPMGAIPVESTFSDYRKVGNLTLPFNSQQSIGPQKISTKIEEILINPEIDPDSLQPPAEIKALAAKQAAK